MFSRRFAVIAALAAFAASTLLPSMAVRPAAAAAASYLGSQVLTEFDDLSWASGSSAAVTSIVTAPGRSDLAEKVDYNLNSSTTACIQPGGTPGDLPGLPRTVSLDVFGDGSWNTIYYEVRDATGEVLRYWVGNLELQYSGMWHTYSLDLGSATPISGLDGNADKVLDLPITFSQIVLSKNTTKFVSTIYLDHLVYQYDPIGARADTQIFVPSAGQTSVVRVSLADQASFNLNVVDEAGRSRQWSGTVGTSAWTTTWDGKDSAGAVMSGSVYAYLTVRRSAIYTYQIPYFAGLPARVPGPNEAQRGVNSFVSQLDTAARPLAQQEASLMEAAYTGMAREEFEWKRVEPAAHRYDWAKFDMAVEILRAHGVSVLGKLVYGSPWDNTAPGGTPVDTAVNYPPSNIQDYVDYAVATVNRYKDRVHYWEIWNEENNSGFWLPSANVAQYTQLLKATYAAIKAEDPTATVVLGGLSTGPDSSYLQGIRDNGGWGSFDVLAIHSYVTGPPDGSAYERWITNAKNIVASYGAKPIWITEFGWSTWNGSGGASQSDQNVYLERAYEIAAQAGIAGISWFEFINAGNNVGSQGLNWGMLNNDLSAKPAYSGFQCENAAIYAGQVPNCSGNLPPPPPAPVDYPDSTFVGITPTRILDTRIGLGLGSPFTSGVYRTFGVVGDLGPGRGLVVPTNAVAVTANLTVTGATSLGYVYLGPDSPKVPSSSSINFPAGDNRANGVTVPLNAGALFAVFIGSPGATTHLVLDITGYYLPDETGSLFVAVAPQRLLDSRYGVGVANHFASKVPQTMSVRGRVDSGGNVIIPQDALAVTGNLTITNQTGLGYAYIGPVSASVPGNSNLNAPPGDNRANNVTVALDASGGLSMTYVGGDGDSADLIFDVSGYFTKSGGWHYKPVVPTRLLDSRHAIGLSGSFAARTPRGFGVRGVSPVPTEAQAVTGNLTVTNQTALGYGFMGPSAPAVPTSSTINFPVGDNRANGVTLLLSSAGTLEICYGTGAGATADFLFDVSGYFH